MRVCVANIRPWGYIASFMWGPVVTLKARNVVCRFASAQLSLSALRTVVCTWLSTHSLLGSKTTCLRTLAIIVCTYKWGLKCSGSLVNDRWVSKNSFSLFFSYPPPPFCDIMTQYLQPLRHCCFLNVLNGTFNMTWQTKQINRMISRSRQPDQTKAQPKSSSSDDL